ncbi:MAG: signal peptidase II [Arenicella sp.]
MPNDSLETTFRPLKWLCLSVLILVMDQLSKRWAVANLSDGSVVDLLPIFNFELVYNTGAAFSFLAGMGGWQQILFTVIAIAVCLALVFAIKLAKTDEKQLVIAYACVIGGALGNVVDRITLGKVVDFIHFFYQNWHFPYFNIADIAIFIGAVLMIMDAFKWRLIK